MIVEAQCSFNNLDGILSGEIDQYVPDYEPVIAKMNEQFDADKVHWEEEAAATEDMQAQKIEAIKVLIEQFKADVADEIFASSGNVTKKYPLVDMELFGNLPASDVESVRWPSKEILQDLRLKKPLKLTKIMTRKADSSLGGIKLCFEGDIETPQFDVQFD